MGSLSFADALFLATSVAALQVLRAKPEHERAGVTPRHLADAFWFRAARGNAVLGASYLAQDAQAALATLRNALDRAQLDGAACSMMDGVDALIHGDVAAAAEAGRHAWVRHGKARHLTRWLMERGTAPAELDNVAQVMDLVAWSVAEIGQSWGGGHAGLHAFDTMIQHACDWLLFREPCRQTLRAAYPGADPELRCPSLGFVAGR